MSTERELNELRKRAEKAELKLKEHAIDQFAEQNQRASNDELRKYFEKSEDARDIFSTPESFIAYVRKFKNVTDRS